MFFLFKLGHIRTILESSFDIDRLPFLDDWTRSAVRRHHHQWRCDPKVMNSPGDRHSSLNHLSGLSQTDRISEACGEFLQGHRETLGRQRKRIIARCPHDFVISRCPKHVFFVSITFLYYIHIKIVDYLLESIDRIWPLCADLVELMKAWCDLFFRWNPKVSHSHNPRGPASAEVPHCWRHPAATMQWEFLFGFSLAFCFGDLNKTYMGFP